MHDDVDEWDLTPSDMDGEMSSAEGGAPPICCCRGPLLPPALPIDDVDELRVVLGLIVTSEVVLTW